VLMILILVIYTMETVEQVFGWYGIFLAFIKYRGSDDEALAVFISSPDTPLSLLYMGAVNALFSTLRLVIADSIMVFVLIL
jgi:hypothetical protein